MVVQFLLYSLTLAFCQWALTKLNTQIKTLSLGNQNCHCLQTIHFFPHTYFIDCCT